MSFSWSHGWLRAWRFTVSCVCVMSSPYISDLPPSSTPRSPTSGENTSRQRGASSATSRPEPRLNGFLTVLVLIRTEHDAREANLLLLQSRTLCIGSVRVPNTPPMDLISRIRFRPLAGAPRSVSSDCNLVGFQSRWLWEGDARCRRLMGGDDIRQITAESEEVSRFSGPTGPSVETVSCHCSRQPGSRPVGKSFFRQRKRYHVCTKHDFGKSPREP